jgi:hypothetical protein
MNSKDEKAAIAARLSDAIGYEVVSQSVDSKTAKPKSNPKKD